MHVMFSAVVSLWFLLYKGTRLAIWNGICSSRLLSVIQK